MIKKNHKSNLSESAQNKLKAMIADTVEKKLQKEMKKITRKLTINFIISGAALAGSCLLARYSSKLVDLVIRSKK